MDIINQYLSDNYIVGLDEFINGERFFYLGSRPRVVCKDGFTISIQASKNHYCYPRASFKPRDGKTYSAVELGYPSAVDDLITFYAKDDEYTKTVYGWVPIDVVVQLIEKHGGIDGTVR